VRFFYKKKPLKKELKKILIKIIKIKYKKILGFLLFFAQQHGYEEI
jgi:hypothetical protein